MGRLEGDNTSLYRHPRVRFFTRSVKKSFGLMKNGRIHPGQGFCAAQFIQVCFDIEYIWIMQQRRGCDTSSLYLFVATDLFRLEKQSF